MSGLAALVAALSGPNAARGTPQAHGVASVATGPVYGPYAARQWRGTTIWQCPGCPFSGTSADAVARHIAAAHPGVAVLMLSGHAHVETAMKGLELGAFDYLMKPVDIEELVFKLQDACEHKSLGGKA